jgi:HEAT repeat protein
MENTEAPISKREQALAVLAAAGASCSISKNTVNKVILLAGSPDQAVRHATIPVLMQIPRGQAVQVLVRLLGDVNPSVQVDAADALGQLQATEAAEPLRELLRHEDPEVAIRAAETLGKMDDRSGLGVLARYVRSDTSLNRRAARALGIMLGQRFRPNAEGVAAARRYLKVNKIK